MQLTDLPQVNVSLNALSAVLLTFGYMAVKTGRIGLHKKLMITAMFSSAAFLICYLVYHFGVRLTKPYDGRGIMRIVYLTILFTHVVLAIVNLPMVIVTAARAFRDRIDRHRAIARITLPIWWYVSVSGVVVYFMLYGI